MQEGHELGLRTGDGFISEPEVGLILVEVLHALQRVEDGLKVDRIGKQVLEVFPPAGAAERQRPRNGGRTGTDDKCESSGKSAKSGVDMDDTGTSGGSVGR